MSEDFQLAFPCPHAAVREPVRLAADGVTLLTAVGAIVVDGVVMNGLKIPSEGLLTPARLTSGLPSPYRIYTDATDFVVTLTGDMSYSFTLPVGMNKAADIKILLEAGCENLEVLESNGTFTLVDKLSLGPGSRISVSGDAAASLGFEKQRGASGREVCPPWGLSSGTGTPRPRFLYPPRYNKSALWEVSYDMHPDHCRRCMSSRVENDIRFRSSGEPGLISDENLLYQTVMKALLTIQTSNVYHPWYGTQIMTLVGSKNAASAIGAVEAEVKRTLDEIIAVQSGLMKSMPLSLREKIAVVERVLVRAHPKDFTTLLVEVAVRNAAYKAVKISIVYTVPGAAGILTKDGKVIGRLGTATTLE